ncbi:MAG: AraC family transcriptional regulator [Lachnospiraceae bacterium]|nr:AraC family transcriptional regulator [Lachnospiraceae bacterium]
MEWIERLNKSINYIEEHITEEISYDELAQIACCSTYHFQRMFTYIAGVSLSEYIRRRKMSLAAVDLQGSNEKIIDISLKYGYSSPTAFNRAFQSIHGVAPSALKNEGVSIKSFPPITFKFTVKGVEELNYRIETKPAFRIVGKSYPLNKEIEQNFLEVPQMWQNAVMDGTIKKIIALMNSQPQGVLGVSACNDNEKWKYYIAVSSTADIDTSLEEYIVPGCMWAIFPGGGTGKSIQELEKRIVTEWLPTSGYEFTEGPDIEVYFNPDPNNTQYEVWIPIKKV